MGAKGSSFPLDCPPFFISHAESEFERVLSLRKSKILDSKVENVENDEEGSTEALEVGPVVTLSEDLTISDVFRLRCPHHVRVSFHHLGTLFALDRNRDG